MSYIKIEWSGYFDFPDGTYQSGSKQGEPYSGEFNPDIIRLTDSGQVKYAIEEGEPTFPTYEEFNFSLENLNTETGEQNFDFERLSVLGRTKEYGGSRDAIGDLFIRVSIPKLNKVVFTGMMEDYSYSVRDFHVEINCYSIIRFIKNSKYSMLGKFDLGSGLIGFIREGSLADSKFALDQATNGLAREAVDVLNNELLFSYVNVYQLNSQNKKVEQIAVGKNIQDYFLEIQGNSRVYDLSDFAGIFDNKFFDRVGANNFSEETLTLSMFRNGLPRQFTCEKTLGWYNVFLQIGKSTVLTRIQPTVNITFQVDKNRKIIGVARADCGINFVHMNNGFSSSVIDEKEVLVYERGRFQKEDGEQYKKDESVSIKILDFDRGLNHDKTSISNGKFYSSVTGKLIDASNKDVFYIGGVRLGFGSVQVKYINSKRVVFENNWAYKTKDGVVYLKDGETEVEIDFIYIENKLSVRDKDSFNVFNHVSNNFSRKFYERFCLNPTNESIFDSRYLIPDIYQHSFISDVGIYDWINKSIAEVIVSLGRKINSYIYINEDSKIAFHSRLIHEKYLPDNKEIPGLVFLEQSQFEIQRGRKYGYGSESYSIKWNDILEINNITSDLDIDEVVTRGGETDDLFVTPKNLEISNYRTSDLGVPSGRETDNYSEDNFKVQSVLRRSPFSYLPEEYFSMMPVQMAKNFARSYDYPSMIYSINVDPFSFGEQDKSVLLDSNGEEILDESNSYIEDEFSLTEKSESFYIGGYVAIRKSETIYGVYMIKEIIYSASAILEKATSISMVLLYISDFIGLSLNLRDESNILILDENNETIETENYA